MSDPTASSRNSAAPASIRVVDIDDVAALERHVAFETAHGIPRHQPDELRRWIGSVDDAVLLVADDVNGNLVGCATASTIAALGLGNVHINMLALPHGHETLRQLADAIEQWHGAARTDALFAHVSGPTLEQEDDWLAAGFERVGTRARLARAIMPGDAEFQGVEVAGITIAALAHEPGLEDAALTLWNECHADIPTSLPFFRLDRAQWLDEMSIVEGHPIPPSLLVAVTADGDLAGLAVLRTLGGIAGHRFTGVSRDWRGRGVASQLKAALIRWAACNGMTELRTSNDADNVAMRAVNDRLGYRELHRIVMFRRLCADD